MTDSISGGLEISGRDLTGARFSERLKRIAHWLSQRNVFDLASCAALIALVILAVWTFQDYAISNDEGVQHRYGELIVAYYKSGFTDQSVFKLDNLYLYGGLFDLLGLGLSYIIPVDQYELRHLLCALIGIGGIGAAAATARLVASPRAAFFTIVALALCGSWYGAMYNHTKGIPLAAFMAGAMYFLIRASRALPTPRMRDVIGFGIMTGAALGIRSLSLLLLGYLCLAILINLPRPVIGHWQERARFALRSALWFLPALVIAYLIMIATWPWAALSPLNPIRGLISFGDFHYHIRTILFGQTYEMADVPRYYVPTYIAIRLPLLTLGATLFSLLLIMLPARAGGVVRRPAPRTGADRIHRNLSDCVSGRSRRTGVRWLQAFPVRIYADRGTRRCGTEQINRHTGAISSLNAGGLARDNRDLLHLDGRQALPPASLRVSLLQSTRRRSGRRIPALRDRLLGQQHAGSCRRTA
jgi:hypothetical protein